jgi:hypothetical protein
MRKKFFLIALCAVAFCFGSIVLLFNFNIASATEPPDMFTQIEEKAKVAKNGQETSIRELSTTIFSFLGTSEIPHTVLVNLTDRISRAEITYRQNNQFVREVQVVKLVNYLATRFTAPNYAQTSPLQVRVVRLDVMLYMPSLFRSKDIHGHEGAEKEENTDLDDKLLPIEAVCLSMIMIRQKMTNPIFQKTNDEWFNEYTEFFNSTNNNQSGFRVEPDRPKAREMRQIFVNQNLVPNEIQQIADEALDQLGIPR